MNWIEIDVSFCDKLKQGTVCKTESGEFVIVGEINTSMGTNDEFTEGVTHYTEYFISDVNEIISKAKSNFESLKK